MAKSKNTEFSFDDLNKELSTVNPLGSVLSENEFSKITEWINTGNYAFNAQLSGSLFGGIPNSRSVELAGPSGVGKSFLCLNIAREAQKQGYYIMYVDSEAAIDEETAKKFGIDPTRIRYTPINTVNQLRTFAANLHKSVKERIQKGTTPPKIMLIIDSLGNMGTEKLREDALSGSDKRDMTKQQNIKNMFSIITTDMSELKIPIIFTNHVYAKIGYVPGYEIGGGSGAVYNPSVIVMLTKSMLKDESASVAKKAEKVGLTRTGILVRSKPEKSRFSLPIPIQMHISFYTGFNPYVGLHEFVDWDLVGIGPGELKESIEEVPDLDENGEQVIYRGKPKFKKVSSGMKYVPDNSAVPKTYAVKHLGKTVKTKDLFTAEVFTEEILKKMDELIIKPTFELPDIMKDDLIEDFGGDEDEMMDQDVEITSDED